MNQPKIGYLPLYIKLYDDNHQDRTPLVRYMETMICMLQSQGLEIVRTEEICRTKEEFARAAETFNRAGVDAVVTQHLAYSPSLESIDALLSLDAPIFVLDSTPDYQLVKTANYQNCIDNDHGIHGVQDMCCMLKKKHRDYTIFAGHALHSNVIAKVADACRAAAMAKAFRTARIGAVGGAFEGMGDFAVTPERLKKDFGIEVLEMTPEVTAASLAAVAPEQIAAEQAWDAQHCRWEVTSAENYQKSLLSGLAIRGWMQREALTACTVNFLTLDRCGMPKMPFAECCKMMARGQGYAGEGDVLTAGLVGALLSQHPDTTFVEMFCPDWEQDVILLSHMAESNPRLAQWKPLLADMPFGYNSCGPTVGMYNCMRPGKAVYVNLAPMEDHYQLIVTEGELCDLGLMDGAYHRNTQGWFRPCMPVAEFLEQYSLAGGTHHSALVYHADAAQLKLFGKLLGFEVIELK